VFFLTEDWRMAIGSVGRPGSAFQTDYSIIMPAWLLALA
jgi:hypothetical protein